MRQQLCQHGRNERSSFCPDRGGAGCIHADSGRSFHRGGADVRCKPFAENLAGLYDGYRRAKLPVVAAVRDAFRRLP